MRGDDEVEVRNAERDELAELRRLLTAANEPYRAAVHPAAFDPYLEMVVALEERWGVAQVLVAVRSDRVTGTVSFFPDAAAEGWGWPSGLAGIRSMGVDPEAQGMGTGAALLRECHRRAGASGAHGVGLHTAIFLTRAIRLYERTGYRRDPAHDFRASDVLDLADPAADFAALAYRLDLRH